MDKLEHLRKVCLVRVNGELVAAGNLAVRKASFSEATERLERLQELAGKFRRTQQSFEENLDDPETVAAAHSASVEFFKAYQAAKELLEKHITNTTPVRAVSRKSSTGSLLDEIRQFSTEVKAFSAAIIGQSGTVPSNQNGNTKVSSCEPLSGLTTTNVGQSGVAGCDDPDGKQRSGCASMLGPTVSSRTLSTRNDNASTEEEPMSNWSLISEERDPPGHPGKATCDGDEDGPEMPIEGEEASVER